MPYLPIEIITQIAEYADGDTLQSLRLAGRTARDAARPPFLRLFEDLIINVREPKLEDAVEKVADPSIGRAVKQLVLQVEDLDPSDDVMIYDTDWTVLHKLMCKIPFCTRLRISKQAQTPRSWAYLPSFVFEECLATASLADHRFQEIQMDEVDEELFCSNTAALQLGIVERDKPAELACVEGLTHLTLLCCVADRDTDAAELLRFLRAASQTVTNLKLGIADYEAGDAATLFGDLVKDSDITFPSLNMLHLRIHTSDDVSPVFEFIIKHARTIENLGLRLGFGGDEYDLCDACEQLTRFASRLQQLATRLTEFSLNLHAPYLHVNQEWSRDVSEMNLVSSLEKWITEIPQQVDGND